MAATVCLEARHPSWFALDDKLPSAGVGLAVVVVSEKQTPLTYASIGLTNL